jgi:hypothetical protein
MKISNYAPYAEEGFETARRHPILHPERIIGNSELSRDGFEEVGGISTGLWNVISGLLLDYGQPRSNVARSSRRFCVQVLYKKAGLKGLKMNLSNAESTTDS